MRREDTDIEEFLRGVISQVGDVDDGVHNMFRMLVATAKEARDNIQAAGKVLTVGETQEALTAFMEVMKTHQVPERLSNHAHILVVKWLEKIKTEVHH
ncbi:MAG: hypothetical protein COX62_09085 [Deltaproteobacteria bacterium CG_4_10_14_0_2_um_filter_43_8]|nr:MAG: hypothetical protein COV43_03425 [Deltaproteobacteria bacterium CG11_big_fil_rev_8_21_14_0_20_42_23]PJA18206.1 MAG: hypothetical protein COX62_09085 [Deltaproteobacteria bacterium CG_4_10_14_0_2_um_filter_43_8]PJC63482.1 MAG: hypothetical protein CO021_09090 [Deltaproteobacteria bacterium CG_4_9_14_0_2_um_filter_42_21]